jgi:hypothetical protein
MFFFFDAMPVHLVNPQTREVVKTGHNAGVMGLATQYNGEMTFNGNYSIFEIIFKPNGFYKIFRIPPTEVVNQIIDAEAIFNSTVTTFFEQLCGCNEPYEMAGVANAYLIPLLKEQKSFDPNDRITSTSNSILKNAGMLHLISVRMMRI